MTHRFPKLVRGAMVVALALIVTAGLIPAQQPPPLPPAANAQPADPNGIDVLTRGPVHEAYAETAQAPAASPIVAKMPPDPIDELPPDQKPEGDNVQWISGYWHWDDDRADFTWISGFWRATPPGRVWVPGSWRAVQGGSQWAAGFWQEASVQQPQQPQQQPEIQYLPPPAASLETGPNTLALTTTSFYVPGSWVWRGRYFWRPGFWIEHRPNWIWVPAHFRWTPAGYIFIEGYWDYPLARRGVMFAPVAISSTVYLQPGYVYTPAYVVSDQCMMGAMFVRRGWGCYYFGDYYGPQYVAGGYGAWCGSVGPGGGFSIGFGVGRSWGYDPLWSYYSVAYRSSPGWTVGMGNLYVGRFNGTIAPPPVTLSQQNVVINRVTNVNVTNVTNNFTVVNRSITVNNVNVSGLAMVAPMKIVSDMHPEIKIQTITPQVRQQEAHAARQVREVAVQRAKHETAVVARGGAVLKPTDVPHTLKLDVPKTAVARAQAVDEKHLPPNPHKPATGVTPKVDHNPLTAPKVDPKHDPLDPKHDPKVDHNPLAVPKVDPKFPKIDPKLPIVPKIDPKHDPKQPHPNPKP